MPDISSAQSLVLFLLTLAAFVTTVYAFVDSVRRPAAAFQYADKRTKRFWAIVLGVAAALSFVSVDWTISSTFPNFLALLPVVAAGIYLADVRPAVRTYGGGPSRGPYGGY